MARSVTSRCSQDCSQQRRTSLGLHVFQTTTTTRQYTRASATCLLHTSDIAKQLVDYLRRLPSTRFMMRRHVKCITYISPLSHGRAAFFNFESRLHHGTRDAMTRPHLHWTLPIYSCLCLYTTSWGSSDNLAVCATS